MWAKLNNTPYGQAGYSLDAGRPTRVSFWGLLAWPDGTNRPTTTPMMRLHRGARSLLWAKIGHEVRLAALTVCIRVNPASAQCEPTLPVGSSASRIASYVT